MTISDIYAEIRALTDTDSSSMPDSLILRRLNIAQEDVVSEILMSDGLWQFDDDNFTTYPEGVTTLVEGQSDYAFSQTFLDIEWVKIKDTAGHWHLLTPIDQSQVNFPLEDYLITNGFPQYYDKLGDAIRLYPAPTSGSITLASGLKTGFKRTSYQFTSGDASTGTIVPGFASSFHVILAYMVAIPYCESYKKDRVALYEKKKDDLLRKLIKFYGLRALDQRKVITTHHTSNR